jgi:glyoxylase-like metal-dependent hydrolase (beta-lactamase superfamily II)
MPEILTYTGGIAATNSHLLSLPGGNVLVDAPEGAASWLQKQKARLDALFLTHQHFDHVLDAAAIKDAHACPIYSFAPFSRDLTLERLYGAVTGSSFEVPAFEIDHLLAGMEGIEAVGEMWRLYHVPGHSPDSVCFHLPRLNLLFGGDVLFRDGVGRTDFPGGSTQQLLSGIEAKLFSLPDMTRVFPGHGEDTTIGRERLENPFLT